MYDMNEDGISQPWLFIQQEWLLYHLLNVEPQLENKIKT